MNVCIAAHRNLYTLSIQRGRRHGQPATTRVHLCGWKPIQFSTIIIIIAAVVVRCSTFFFSFRSSSEARIVVASEHFHEIVCTRKGLTLANPNERFKTTEKATHDRSILTCLYAPLCKYRLFFSYIFFFFICVHVY